MGSTQHRNFCLITVSLLLILSPPAAGIPIRLSGYHQCSGTVEIYYNGAWGTVCDDSWDLNDATVVCRQLDCGAALSTWTDYFGPGTGQIRLHVDCSGSERSLTECQLRQFGEHCEFGKDAGVVCSEPAVNEIKKVILSLILVLVTIFLYFCGKASRGQKSSKQWMTEVEYHYMDLVTAGRGPAEEE